jgi:hypothetical protein
MHSANAAPASTPARPVPPALTFEQGVAAMLPATFTALVTEYSRRRDVMRRKGNEAVAAEIQATIDKFTVARYRADGQSAYFHEGRSMAGLPELVDCDGCEAGIAQRVVDDYADDTGPSYEAVGGCSIVKGDALCPACTAARA